MTFKIEINDDYYVQNNRLFFDLRYKNATIASQLINKKESTVKLSFRNYASQVMFEAFKFKINNYDSLYIIINDCGLAFGECLGKVSDTIFISNVNFLKPYEFNNYQVMLVEYKRICNFEEFEKNCNKIFFRSRKKYITNDGVCIDCYNEMKNYNSSIDGGWFNRIKYKIKVKKLNKNNKQEYYIY